MLYVPSLYTYIIVKSVLTDSLNIDVIYFLLCVSPEKNTYNINTDDAGVV